MDTNFQGSFFSGFSHHNLDFFLSLLYHLFDSGWMNTSIYDKFFQCNSCHFSPDRIKAGKDNCFRSIINNQINTGQCFKCSDVSTFSSDNTAFHFIIWKLDNRNRCLRNMICSTFLNGCNHIFLRLFTGFFFRSGFQFLDKLRRIKFYVIFDSSKQQILRLIGSQSGNSL